MEKQEVYAVIKYRIEKKNYQDFEFVEDEIRNLPSVIIGVSELRLNKIKEEHDALEVVVYAIELKSEKTDEVLGLLSHFENFYVKK